ncbi:DUF802 domain-containing protein [Variovorax dokdonensis]|uniref:DUF802 domain-containing protein n=1 Tax=Variovorax dokdonensis TaxID=344883 RepID=A0ABT7NDM9_9BURK|nr:DUF802 domain-containing protein [Variovorax dokdonensis]MDM0046066.1 DUF802 domain-containing protein [Variovorax dokdonensis]
MNRLIERLAQRLAFVAGLATVCWIGFGYIGTNTIALGISLLILVFYVSGALELFAFDRATSTLREALERDAAQAPANLGDWLARVHPSLQGAVRLRIEGERVGLPGPSLTPYLAGLLVLLGMLGTFLGMVVTLRGTGLALEHATDLDAIRAVLAEPVKGLGLAFGTSIAGVAASAMLGLVSSLCRRDRIEAARLLDAQIASTLRPFSRAQRREESFELMRRQGEALPALVERLEAAMSAMAEQHRATHAQLLATQDRFQSQAGSAYTDLAAAVAQTLHKSLEDGARAAGAAMQPAIEASSELLRRQGEALPALIERLDSTRDAIDRQQREAREATDAQQRSMHASIDEQQRSLQAVIDRQQGAVAESLAQEQRVLAQSIGEQQEAIARTLAEQQRATHEHLLASQAEFQARTEAAYAALAASVDQSLQKSLVDGARAAGDAIQPAVESAMAAVTREAAALRALVQEGVERQMQGLAEQADRATQGVAQRWNEALAEHSKTLADHASAQHAQASDMQQALQARLAERDEARLAAWSQALQDMSGALQEQWQQAITNSNAQQQAICQTLERTASDITRQSQAQAQDTLAEIGRLVDAASEAPRAAADVVAELRTKLSDSMVRDNAMLEERSRMLETLQTLLDAVNHASVGQREAIDALVSTSADLMERVGQRFAQEADAQSGKLADVAAQVGSSAVEMASLGDAFGAAVQQFGQSNEKLAAQLQRIETALTQSMARSDEQLAYYVAQAREVIDLSILSQKQIVEDLQQLAHQRQPAAADA